MGWWTSQTPQQPLRGPPMPKRTHESMIKSVLGSGAAVRILIRSPLPSPQYYLIERIFGGRARVRDQNGDLLQNVSPQSVLGNVEVYGQHEISELTRFPEKLAELLRRFTEPASDKTAAKARLKEDLERSRDEITSEVAEIGRMEEALAVFPTLRAWFIATIGVQSAGPSGSGCDIRVFLNTTVPLSRVTRRCDLNRLPHNDNCNCGEPGRSAVLPRAR